MRPTYKMAARQLRFRRAAWTLNNYSDEELKSLKDNVNQFRYIVWGYEIAPNTGTKHLQGYSALEKPATLDRFKSLISDRAHIEIAKASEEKNREYCVKSGHFEEFGRINSQGQRNDLYNVVDTLLENKEDPIGAVAETHPVAFIKFHRGIKDLANTLRLGAKRNHRTKLCIVYGYPGTGKSYGVRQICDSLYGDDETFYKTRGEWWDGYCNHKAIIIDDFYGWLKYDELLKIADRYPYKVPIKGSFANFIAEWIFITSNAHPEEWYHFKGYNWTALRRRIDILIHLPNP